MNSYSIPHALLMAQFVLVAFDWAAHRFARTAGARWGLRALTIVCLLALLAPVLIRYKHHVQNHVRVARGEAPRLRNVSLWMRPLVDVSLWLRENAPPPSEPNYSVLGPWDAGHVIKYLAGRPTVQDNFGDDVAVEGFAQAERYFASTDEAEAMKILQRSRTRYVIVRADGSGSGWGYAPGSMLSRLFVVKGSLGKIHRRDLAGPIQVDALEHHRLLYESQPRTPQETNPKGNALTHLKLFEIVSGAVVTGQAEPGAVVSIALQLNSRNGDPFVYRNAARADEAGRYRLRLPYPNEEYSEQIRVAKTYSARVGNRSDTFVVTETAVQQGLAIEGPNF